MQTAAARQNFRMSSGRIFPACARSKSRRNARFSSISATSALTYTETSCIKDGVGIDPAAGSGNFLTETYISLRRLENDALFEETHGQMMLGMENIIQVSIGQFYGIEINDFAVTVAKTALWIVESQMMQETENLMQVSLDFLPLKSYANIAEGNSLRIDWADVVPKEKLSYIMGNPPFVGGMFMSKEQKKDITDIFGDIKGIGEFDYVCAWYKKATEVMKGTMITSAFVSTNSICQGQQVITFWKYSWMRTVAGRLKSDYRYSKDIVYNNFPWCEPTLEQCQKIEKTAQRILDVRAKYADCSLANMYGEKMYLFGDLEKAHQANDCPYLMHFAQWMKLIFVNCK